MSFTRVLRALSLRIVLALVLCAAVVVAGVVVVNRYIDDQVAKIPRLSVSTVPASSQGANFLVVGSDSRAFVDTPDQAAAFGSQETQGGPPRSDTLMVLHVDGDHTFAVSFPRDLWVSIPGRGSAKINAAFNDGPQKVIDTLKQDFGVDINHYLEVNFVTFEKIVDAIGTVPMWFPAPARDEFSGLNVAFGGCDQLDGPAALAFVRSRHLQYLDLKTGVWHDADPIPDIGRIARQQAFVKELGDLAVKRSIGDPFLARDIGDRLVPYLKADRSFDRTALNQVVRSFLGLAEGNQGAIEFETLPWTGGPNQGGQQVLYLQQPDADAVLARLRTFGEKSSSTASNSSSTTAGANRVSPHDVTVRVLNATQIAGAAGNAEAALVKLGFVSGGTGNDPRVLIDHSEIRYGPNALAKAQLLAGYVADAKLVPDATISGADVVLVLGRSFNRIAATTTLPATTAPASSGAATSTTSAAQAACK